MPFRQYVALDGQDIVGRVRSVDAAGATWCADVYVNPSHRRRGIGQALLGRMLRDDRARGSKCSVLTASHTGALLYPRVAHRDALYVCAQESKELIDAPCAVGVCHSVKGIELRPRLRRQAGTDKPVGCCESVAKLILRRTFKAARAIWRSVPSARTGCRIGCPTASRPSGAIILLDTCESGALVAGHAHSRGRAGFRSCSRRAARGVHLGTTRRPTQGRCQRQRHHRAVRVGADSTPKAARHDWTPRRAWTHGANFSIFARAFSWFL